MPAKANLHKPQIQTQDGDTAFILAARYKHLRVMQLLTARGADVNAANKVTDTHCMARGTCVVSWGALLLIAMRQPIHLAPIGDRGLTFGS